MPRNPDGSYSLPLPPVISGTTVESNWANTSLDDIRVAMQDSLSRSAQGSMLANLKIVDGSKATPGIGFVNEANTGFYRPDAGDLYVSVLGQDYMRWTDDNGVQFSLDGSTWVDIGGSVTAVAWDNNTLTLGQDGEADLTVAIIRMNQFKSGGVIRHISSNYTGVTAVADISVQSRFTLGNDGNMTLTILRPTGADPELGETYCVEGSILVTNTATPGTITLNNDAGAVPANHILGAANTDPNAVYVLTYCVHREAGDVYHDVYSWCT